MFVLSPVLRDIFPTAMARCSLFVLKVLLYTDQLTHGLRKGAVHPAYAPSVVWSLTLPNLEWLQKHGPVNQQWKLVVMVVVVIVCCVFLAAVTKFSRYNESSDSDEGDTSDSESSSSSSDSDASNDDDRPASSSAAVSPTRAADSADADVSLADNHDNINDTSASISEHSPTQQASDVDRSVTPAEQTDLPTDSGTNRLSPEPHESASSSSLSDRTSPIRSPLQLDSISLPRVELQKAAPAFRHRAEMNARRSSLRKYEFPAASRQSDIKGESSPLRMPSSFSSCSTKNYSTSELQPLSHSVGKRLSPVRHIAASKDRKSPIQSAPREQGQSLDSTSLLRSRSPEMLRISPRNSRYDNSTERRDHISGAHCRSRSCSRSPTLGRSPVRTSMREFSPRQRSTGLQRSPRSRSSSRSGTRSRSREGSPGSRIIPCHSHFSQQRSPSPSRSRPPVIITQTQIPTRSGSVGQKPTSPLPSSPHYPLQSPSRSGSRSPVIRSPIHSRTRSQSLERKPSSPLPHGYKQFARHSDPRMDSELSKGLDAKSPTRYPPADPHKDAARRRSSRSSSVDGKKPTTYPGHVNLRSTAESHKLSAKSSQYRRSSSRSPEGELRRTGTKSFSRSEISDRHISRSRSSSRHRSLSPGLSEKRSPYGRSSPDQRERKNLNADRQDGERYRSGRYVGKPKDTSSRLPELRGRLSPLPSRARSQSPSSDRSYATSRRRSPVNRPRVQNSLVSNKQRVRDRLGRSPQRTNEPVQSYVSKRYSPPPPDRASLKAETNSRYQSRLPDRHCLDRKMQSLPVRLKPKLSVKSEARRSRRNESQPSVQKKYKQDLIDSPSKHSRTSPDQCDGTSVVEKPMKLTGPDNFVPKSEEMASDRGTKSIGLIQSEQAKNDSSLIKPGEISTRKAVTLIRPAAAGAAVLEARKRRFEQTQDADSRSVCIRSSSGAEFENRAKLRRRLSPAPVDKSEQPSKDIKEADADREVVDKSKETAAEKSGKIQTDLSDISDPTSAESSMSLEDISEDETPRVWNKQFGERSDLDATQHRPGRCGVAKVSGHDDRHGRGDQKSDDEDVTGTKISALSSIVKPVKKDTAQSETGRPGNLLGHDERSQMPTEAQTVVDDSIAAEDAIVIKTASRNVVRKGWLFLLHISSLL